MTEEIKNLLEKSSISLLLDSYDAIFSDFDPRPYSERAISDDFLLEAKKAAREVKPGVLELRFLIPKHLHNTHEDAMIRERLHHYFKKHESILEAEVKGVIRKGILLVCFGLFAMFLSSLIAHYVQQQSLFYDFLRVLFEPVGWFTVWYGLDQVFYISKQQRPELDFYRKMAHAEIYFDLF